MKMPDPVALRSRIKLRQLLLLEALEGERSLHKAARRIAMTQPNATRLLNELEDLLGVPLFERSASGMVTTPYGDAMIHHAKVLLADLDRAAQDIALMSRGSSGHVRIGTMPSTAPHILAKALGRCAENEPALRISLIEGAHEMLADRLLRGELDIVIGRARPDVSMQGLSVTSLVREAYSLVCKPLHPLADRASLQFADVVDEGWILPPPQMPVRQNLDALFSAVCGRTPPAMMESQSLFVNLLVIRNSRLLCMMPMRTATAFEGSGLLKRLPLDLQEISDPVVMLLREGAVLSQGAQRLVGWLEAEARIQMHNEGGTAPVTRPA
ncbi:MAG: LysR family transcriptional regulator [Rhodoferax sp.]|nr:LysR family transcriptional regulator [Rhodoferax sp.]MCB2031235.1 LysR family transcriptional regulator [Rhodoferax sp.]MCB2039607.1 LysR family transcriptional regulator [Rhodoferax sp.]MCW5627877.1 LysR family transcriptional regulator [Rhodoferax sp.]